MGVFSGEALCRVVAGELLAAAVLAADGVVVPSRRLLEEAGVRAVVGLEGAGTEASRGGGRQ